ncbi:hypothetical protein [Streptomyces sp. G1]|uniref:hypothetical protein n=1 Tax=Streptomyces sp. G1 TaxID=361572 RepID=UPI00202FD1FB|nr:hypothetical protein [Streptomyces sp. G1]MCM1974527.1 hypothetical protein [Streptomyces sp. G1]
MSLITEYSTMARPDRGIVQVYDADAYLGDDETLARSRAEVAAGNGYHLYLHSLQADVEVQVTIKIWDSPQKPPVDVEGIVTLTLESETGQLVVNQLTYGPAGVMELPRPGVYDGQASWIGRNATAAYCESSHRRSVEEEWSKDQLRAAWAQCPATEQYTLDLWFVRESEDEDDEE